MSDGCVIDFCDARGVKFENHYPDVQGPIVQGDPERWKCSRCDVRLGKHEAVVVNR